MYGAYPNQPVAEPIVDQALIDAGYVELDERVNDGLIVRLLWSPTTNRTAVRIEDTKLGGVRVIWPEEGNHLDVFRHPYAY